MMRTKKIGLVAFTTLLTIVSISLAAMPAAFKAPQVLSQTVNERKAEADRLLEQGIKQLNTSQFEAALQSEQQALIIYREIKDRRSEGAALGNLGAACLNLGNYAKAIEYQMQLLAIAREIRDRQSEGKALGNLGVAYRNLGNYAKAIEYEMKSLTVAREVKDRESEGEALGDLGLAYRRLGNYAKAIEYEKQWLAIAREVRDRQSEGMALGNLGLAYYSLGNYAKAIEYEKHWLMIAVQIKDRQSEGKALGNLGLAYYSLGNYAKAIEYSQQVLAIAVQIKDRQSEGAALGSLGLAYLELGNYAKAIEYEKQWLAIALQIKDRQSEGVALGNLGLAYHSLGNYAKAIEYEKQWLAITVQIKDRQSEGKALGNLGLAYFYLGNYAKATEYYQQFLMIAVQIKDRQSEGNVLGNLGLAYFYLGNYAKAIEYEKQQLAIAREIRDRQSEWLALNNLGLSLHKKGNLADAQKTLFEGITVLESLRGALNDTNKVSIFEKQARTYRILQEVLIAQNKTDTALEIAERGRARAIVELLASRFHPQAKLIAPTIQEIKQISQAQSSTIVQYSIIYNEFKIAGKEQAKESSLYIWVIKPTGEITFRKTDLKPLWQKDHTSLDELAIASRESIGARGRGGVEVSYKPNVPSNQNQFKRLHELLIKPIADLLPKRDSDRVIFIPQSALFLVPFPALQDHEGKYLIEKHTILTSPSIQVLGLTHQQKKGTGDALVVGNPTMPSVVLKIGEPPQQLQQLPGAEKEAQAIAPLLKTQPLIGNQATEAKVLQRLPRARFIYLATHGILDDVQGLNSSIALTPSGKDDGLLKAEDILNLKLNAELVVLSACDTGRGKITGDGVIGLSRSLISAGVPSVIVSLWAISDDSTAFLMTEFYQNLQRKLDKATALKKAMLATKQKYPSPLQWAAFTLIGEAS